MKKEETFATCICCIDGRVHLPLIKWIKKNHNVDYVDLITVPGSDKVISENSLEDLCTVKNELDISLNAHESKTIIVSGHYDCKANVVSREEHIIQIKKTINIISSWEICGAKVIGVWVNEKFKVEII